MKTKMDGFVRVIKREEIEIEAKHAYPMQSLAKFKNFSSL